MFFFIFKDNINKTGLFYKLCLKIYFSTTQKLLGNLYFMVKMEIFLKVRSLGEHKNSFKFFIECVRLVALSKSFKGLKSND